MQSINNWLQAGVAAIFQWQYIDGVLFKNIASRWPEWLLLFIGLRILLELWLIEAIERKTKRDFDEVPTESFHHHERARYAYFHGKSAHLTTRAVILQVTWVSIINIGIALGLVLPLAISLSLFTGHPTIPALEKPAIELTLDNLRLPHHELISLAFLIFIVISLKPIVRTLFELGSNEYARCQSEMAYLYRKCRDRGDNTSTFSAGSTIPEAPRLP